MLLICSMVSLRAGAIGNNLPICKGRSNTLTATGTGTWSSSNTTIASVSTVGAVTGVSPGTATITYTRSVTDKETATVTINPLPEPIAGTATLCVGSVYSLTNDVTGGTWSSASTDKATINASTAAVTAVGAGTSVISYTLPTGCGVACTVTVSSLPAIALSAPSSICAGSVAAYTGTAAGGASWSSSNAGVVDITTGGAATGVATGTAIVTLTAVATGCTVAKTVTVTATQAPVVGATSVCTGTSATYTTTATGGTWTVSNTSLATIPSSGLVIGNMNAISAGVITVIYSKGGAAACQSSLVVTINQSPAAITGDTSVCPGLTSALSSATAGGSWATTNTAVATVASGVVTGLIQGTSTISYSLSNGCARSVTLIVYPEPSYLTFNGVRFTTLNVCVGGSKNVMPDTAYGLSLTSSDISIMKPQNATDGVILGISVGTAILTFNAKVTNGSCTRTFVVNVTQDVAAITGASSVCTGATITLSDLTSGGSWYSGNTAVASINALTGVLTGVAVGTALISYRVGAQCMRTTVITVNGLPSAGSITGTPVVCAGHTTLLANAVSGGTWSSSNGSIATVDAGGVISGISSGTVIISYSVANSCSTASATKVVTVSACCLSDYIIINTGYDQATGTAIAGLDSNGGAAPVDPEWLLTYLSPDAVSIIAAQGFERVANGANADVINTNLMPYYAAGTWGTYPYSSWITAQNAHGYFTYGGSSIYKMVFSRVFRLCTADSIRLDMHVMSDNFIQTIDVDSALLSFPIQDSTTDTPFKRFTPMYTTLYLSAGTHTINVLVGNWNVPGDTALYNPTGLNIHGKVYSANGTHSLVSEDAACASYSCPSGRPAPQDAVVAEQESTLLFPNPNNGDFALSATFNSGSKATFAGIEIFDMAGRLIIKDISPISGGRLYKNIHLDTHLSSGVYMLRLTAGNDIRILRFDIKK